MGTVRIKFSNRSATPKEIEFDISKEAVEPMMSWYGAYHAGDRYSVSIDGKKVKKDINGELIP
jgi:hypothetical protein